MNIDQFSPLNKNVSGNEGQYSQLRNSAADILGMEWYGVARETLLNVNWTEKVTHPLARIILEKFFENVCNLRRISLTSMAIDISVLIDRETRFSKFPSLVTVESPWLIKSLELDDIVSRCSMT